MGIDMRKDIFDNLFEDLFKDVFSSSWFGSQTLKAPEKLVDPVTGKLRLYDTDNDERGMNLRADLPGVDPKSLTVEVTGTNQVVVSGLNNGKTFINRYTISSEFDVQTAIATWKHGQLIVRIMRAANRDNRRITVDIAK